VPYSSFSTEREQGVQLIDFDRDTLTKRGFIAHNMQARRSTIRGDRIVSISGRELLSVDASDRDKPEVIAETELAWPVDRVFVQGDFLLELEAGSYWDSSASPRLRVANRAEPDRMLNALVLKDLPITGATLRDGRLYLLQAVSVHATFDPAENDDGTQGGSSTEVLCSVIDVSGLPELALLSTAVLKTEGSYIGTADPVWPQADLLVWVAQQGWSWGPWWGWGGVTDDVMPIRGGFWSPWSWYQSGPAKLFAVDVRDPARLEFASELELNTADGWPSFSKPYTADQLVYLSQQRTEVLTISTNYIVVTNVTYIVVTNNVTEPDYVEPPPPDSDKDPGPPPTPPGGERIPVYTVTTNAYPVYTWRRVSELRVIDYTAPAAPLERKPISIPGELRGLSHDGALLYLVGHDLAAKDVTDGADWLHACAYDGASAFLVDSHPLPRSWPRSLLVREPYIFIARPAVETTSSRAIEVWTLSAGGKFTRLGESALASNAYRMQRVNDLLAVQGEHGIEVFDLSRPVELPLVGRGGPSGCLGWNLDHASGSMRDGLWLPLGLYGSYLIEIER
jgi:hypothetical protein